MPIRYFFLPRNSLFDMCCNSEEQLSGLSSLQGTTRVPLDRFS